MAWYLLFAILLLAGVLLFRMGLFRSLQQRGATAEVMQINANDAAGRLSGAVQIPTLSFNEGGPVDSAPFKQFRDYLEVQFPQVHQILKREIVAGDSLLFTWEGGDLSQPPVLLLAHSDVVPAGDTPGNIWTYPPFSGQIADGFVWGRGTLDDKVSALGILEAVEYLLSKKFKPVRSLLIAIGHDEEVGGTRGAAIVGKLLAERGIKPEFILDEGGVIVANMIGDLTLATVGIAEKGYVTARLNVEGKPGHSSQPPAHTTIGQLSAAIQRIETHPWTLSSGGVMAAMLRYLGPEMSFLNRLMLANMWLFGSLVVKTLAKNPAMNAMMRTTSAATLISGGTKDNILPASASASINCRILPGETIQQTLDHLQQAANDPAIHFEPVPGFLNEPSPVSSVDSPAFQNIQKTVAQIFPRAVFVPYLTVGGTDTKHYVGLTKNIYRFLPAALQASDLSRIHGCDERISIEAYGDVIKFYVQLLLNSLGKNN